MTEIEPVGLEYINAKDDPGNNHLEQASVQSCVHYSRIVAARAAAPCGLVLRVGICSSDRSQHSMRVD